MKLIYRIMGQSVYQPMSRLLFCNQLQLEHAEYIIMNTGIAEVNVTDPIISISDYYPVSIADYYPVSPSGIRICADTYVQRARGKEAKSAGAVCTMSIILFITILVTGAVAFVGHLNL